VYKSNVLISTENNNTLNDFYLNLTQKERLISLSILYIYININDSNENIHSLLFIKIKKKSQFISAFVIIFNLSLFC
jgi:hypothetical protein